MVVRSARNRRHPRYAARGVQPLFDDRFGDISSVLYTLTETIRLSELKNSA